ncbi:hypothetical protein FLONG3_6893 [Fusarium longipes]|uniref:Uncharacterized protein n=1 Tax=Fusarium longipes TaxID=694270 RepID=A0A395SHR8_9HYPO|nr:hypothetical protein FLONG3_6893 [Fusarium longipes]
MQSTDIRDVFDFDGKDVKEACLLLHRSPPLWDCNMLDCNTWKDLGWPQKSESRNPILTHAWHVFGDAPEDVERTTQDRKKVEETLKFLGIDPRASFQDLYTSALMIETFWSNFIFLVSEPVNSVETGETVTMSPEEIFGINTLVLDHAKTPNACLQDIVKQRFGRREWKGDQVALIPTNPYVFRVVYHTDNSQSDSLTINQLKTVWLPTWAQVGDAPVSFAKNGQTNYFLSAVVRNRPNQNAPDLVRTYNAYGVNMRFKYEPETFMSKDWSIKDAPRTYFLFHQRLDIDIGLTNPHNFPEVYQPPYVNQELVDSVESFMARVKLRLPELTPKPDELTADTNRDRMEVDETPNHPPRGENRTAFRQPPRRSVPSGSAPKDPLTGPRQSATAESSESDPKRPRMDHHGNSSRGDRGRGGRRHGRNGNNRRNNNGWN